MLNIAHRGASAYAPENTRAAFDLAIEMRAEALETDIQLSADGELVAMHDDCVDRTSNGRGPLADHTLAELRGLDCGRWFGEKFAGERILTLEELLARYAGRIGLVLEIKDTRATPGLIQALLRRGLKDGIEVTSFDWGALLEARKLAPELACGYLCRSLDADLIERSARRGFRQIMPRIDKLTPENVAAAHRAGLLVRAWGLSKREQLPALFQSGADGAGCNWPDWIPAYAKDATTASTTERAEHTENRRG